MPRRKYLRLLGFFALAAAMVALNVLEPPKPPPSGRTVDFAHGPGAEERRLR